MYDQKDSYNDERVALVKNYAASDDELLTGTANTKPVVNHE